MPTSFTVPFQKGEDLKAAFSAIDQTYNLDNVRTSLERAAEDLKDIVSDAVYTRMIDYYNLPPDGNEVNDQLVLLCQRAMAPLAFYHHFIWLQLRVSNNSITVSKSDDESRAFKYQTDEAKDELLKSAWAGINLLIAFMDDEQLTEWVASDQYTALQELLFKDYKTFGEYFGIDRNAAFFIKTRYLQKDTLTDEVIPRFGKISEISDEQLLIKLKRAVSMRVMALAIWRFDAFWLPTSIRKDISNENRKRSVNSATDTDLKEKTANALNNLASDYFDTADKYWTSKNSDDTSDVNPLIDYMPDVDESNKFFNSIV